MGQMTVEQWYGTIKTGLTKKLTENKEALPAGFNQQRFILNCITVIQDMMKDDKKKAQLEKINPCLLYTSTIQSQTTNDSQMGSAKSHK